MTARHLFHVCRKAGINLSAKAGSIAFEAPAGVLTTDLRSKLSRIKSELLAVLNRYYDLAAVELVRRETLPGEYRDDLVTAFDEQCRNCVNGGMGLGEAQRITYVALAKKIEQAVATVENKAS